MKKPQTSLPDIPVDFLFDSSMNTLQEYELKRLEAAAAFRKEVRALLELCIENELEARFARWLLEHREELRRTVGLVVSAQKVFDFSRCADSGSGSGPSAYTTDRLRSDAAD